MLLTVMPVPALTVIPGTKFVPVKVTVGAVARTAEVGLMAVNVGGPITVKPFSSVPLCPSVFVTTTLTSPGGRDGVIAVINVACTARTDADTPPNCTVAPVAKFVPAIVTIVPPVLEPDVGVIEDTIGALLGAHGLVT
jgi:hypothetical protein